MSLQAHIDRIKEEIPIEQLLHDLGYDVRPGGGFREQQFSCDLHGDGIDNKPSARMYPDSNSWYCFACSKARDAIDTVSEKLGLTLAQAIRWLEKEYNLPVLPWDDERPEEPKPTLRADMEALADDERTFEQVKKHLASRLDYLTQDRDASVRTVARFWEAYDGVLYKHDQEQIDEDKARKALQKLWFILDEELKNERPTP